jgi:hypothetical protein
VIGKGVHRSVGPAPKVIPARSTVRATLLRLRTVFEVTIASCYSTTLPSTIAIIISGNEGVRVERYSTIENSMDRNAVAGAQ